MNLQTAVEKLSALPEEKQATVLDFIEFLSSRPPTSALRTKDANRPLVMSLLSVCGRIGKTYRTMPHGFARYA